MYFISRPPWSGWSRIRRTGSAEIDSTLVGSGTYVVKIAFKPAGASYTAAGTAKVVLRKGK
jgi:hypothetical protein